jgi:two-component sensor histidine kinase
MTNESLLNSEAVLFSDGAPDGSGCRADPSVVESLDHAFLKEVHHRIKNNLQVVCSLLRIQGRGVADLSMREVLKRSEERIQGMALVYDKLYKSEQHDSVPLDQYLREMVTQLVSSVRAREVRPQLEFRLQPVFVQSRLATSIGLLVNEIVSNHLRVFATDSNGPLTLSLGRDGANLIIELREPDRHRPSDGALGAIEQQILDALIRQVNGALSYSNSQGVSTRISFPMRQLR